MSDYRILVTGSRLWTDTYSLHAALNHYLVVRWRDHGQRLVVIHGHARRGADALADAWADANAVAVERHPARWRPHGIYNPHAGLVRNRKMVELGADVCLGFIVGNSRGASHCVRLAEEAGIETRIYRA